MFCAKSIVVFLIVIANCVCQICEPRDTCSKCIQTPGCSWCSQPRSPTFSSVSRCFSSSTNSLNCLPEYIVNYTSVITDQRRSEDRSMSFKPDRIKIKLRVGESFPVPFTFTSVRDHPVDLYYLMDLSYSMKDDKQKLSQLGSDLALEMRQITSQLRLGFGSFVDKETMPFISTTPENLKNPCAISGNSRNQIGCAPAYGFKNHLSLQSDPKIFADEVSATEISGNIDSPEAGLDALIQVAVCGSKIGWSDKARRVVVVATDAEFHQALDGKLGGIVEPNDMECHLDENRRNTHSTLLDYPSVSQINFVVHEASLNVIFAVTNNRDLYKALVARIEGASMGELSSDSNNVVTLVKQQYEKISSSVILRSNSSELLDVYFMTSCNSSDGQMVNSSTCVGLGVDQVVNFTIQIQARRCPDKVEDQTQILQVYPVGLNASLIIEIELICQCECEKEDHETYMANSASCSGIGSEECGICNCGVNRAGDQCQCDLNQGNLNVKDVEGVERCYLPANITAASVVRSAEICSGRGTCFCGGCRCQQSLHTTEVVDGDWCECDNFSCPRDESGLLCSGRGTCVCGNCQCNSGWSGENCDCSTAIDNCLLSSQNQLCSGNGVCQCGQCQCLDGPNGERYRGNYCQFCITCADSCHLYSPCIQCRVFNYGEYNGTRCDQECNFEIQLVDELQARESRREHLCETVDTDTGCRFSFFYGDNDFGGILVRTQLAKECPEPVQVLGLALGSVGGTLLLGLALILLWRILVFIHDGREYARFEKDIRDAKWDRGENPLYKTAVTSIQNPTFQTE